jgi:hypothetical protein
MSPLISILHHVVTYLGGLELSKLGREACDIVGALGALLLRCLGALERLRQLLLLVLDGLPATVSNDASHPYTCTCMHVIASISHAGRGVE